MWDGIDKRKNCQAPCIDIETIKEELGELRTSQAVLAEKVTAFLDSTVEHRRGLRETLIEIKESLPTKEEISSLATLKEKVKTLEDGQKIIAGGFVTVVVAFVLDIFHRIYK